jgi:hypothetical protein
MAGAVGPSELRLPAGDTARKMIEQMPDAAVVVAGPEIVHAHANKRPVRPAPDRRVSRPVVAALPQTHVFGEGGAAHGHHAERPASALGDRTLRVRARDRMDIDRLGVGLGPAGSKLDQPLSRPERA